MSSVRIAVKWRFGEVVKRFAFLDSYKNLRIDSEPVETMYTFGTLLQDYRVCNGA